MSKLGDRRRAEFNNIINNSIVGGSETGNQRRAEMYDTVNRSNGNTEIGNRRRAEINRLLNQWEDERIENNAKNSTLSFDSDGEINKAQTLLNFKSYIDGFKQHRKENEEYEHQKQRERNAYLANWEKHGGKTFELFGKTYGIGKVDDDFLEEQKKIDEAFKQQRKSEKIPSTDALPSPSDVGMPSPDNIRRTAESAQHLAKHYGVGTAQIIGSDTRKNIETYQKEYSDMSYGEKLVKTPKIAAGNYALDLISAGLTTADTLTAGKLGRGELGKASSIFDIADFLQSGSSELVGMSYGTMRESTNWLGKLVLDLERTGTEQIMDRVVGAGNGLIPMGVRVFGAGAQEAQSEGKGLGDQIKTGLIRSGIEVGTELLGGVGGSWRGTGYGDAVFSALDRWIAGKTGSELLGTMASAFGSENLEEMISDVLNPLADRIFNLSKGDAPYWEEVWGDGQILYDGLLGGLAGLGGGALTHLGTTAQAKSLGVDVATYKAAQRIVESNSLKKKFENYSGVELSEDNSDAIVETAVILTGYSSDEVSSRDIEQEVRSGAESRAEFAGNGALDATIHRMGLSDEEANIIREGFTLGKAEEIIYAKGIEEAYEYGKAGASESVMLKRGSFVGELTQIQRAHAYELGKMAKESKQKNRLELEKYAKKFGPQAESVKAAYVEGQNVGKYIQAYGTAYNMGKAYMGESALSDPAISYLNEDQKELAYRNGRIDADNAAAELQAAIVPNGKTGHKPGKVTAQGISVKELSQTFNDPQRKAFNILREIAGATGINIVLYKSEAGESGRFTDAQGKFKRNEDTIYIDINAGLYYTKDVNELSKYTMLRTFSHELTHFIEKWSPEQYNELRETVFEELNKRGENANDLIEGKMAKSKGMSYDAASREVVAEAMTDILPDSSFIENLAAEHKTLFEKIRENLREFASEIKAYFDKLVKNPAREANALKEQVGEGYHYIESIVAAFDKAASSAVKNYQAANAVEKVKTENNKQKESKIDYTATETERLYQKEPEIGKDNFRITRNEEHDGIEIFFNEKPSEAVRNVLKENKFRWHKKKKIWYGRAEAETMAQKIREAESEPEEEFLNFDPKVIAEELERRKTDSSRVDAMLEHANNVYNENNDVKKVSLSDIVDRIQEPSFNEDSIKDVRSMVKLISQSEEATQAVMESNLSITDFINKIKDADPEETDQLIDIKQFVPKEIRNEAPKTQNETPEIRNDKAATDTKDGTKNIKQEVKTSEDADNSETVQQPDGDRQGDARLLDELEAGNVSGNAQERNSVGSPSEGERQTVRNGRGSDSRHVTPGTGSGNGDSESRVPGSGELKAEVETQIERGSTEKPRGQNFVIGDSLDLPSGDKSKFKANVEAIRLLKQLEVEDRYATVEEQKILSKYVGWGGLANAFDERKSDWAKEYSELKELLTKEEYEAARASTLNAHYTDIQVIKAMYEGLEQLGFKGGRMLEPASGVGNFVGAMPESMSAKVKSWTMVELDSVTGRIAHYLYPYADVRVQGFEKANIPDNFMDVAISNVPFGNFPITDKKYPKRVTSAIHNYFFAKALDKVRPGGIVMFITSRFTMDGRDTAVRKYISERADLLGAIRLPDTAFKGNAGTDVVADILILKKRALGTEYAGEDFQDVNYIYERGISTQINTYFHDHPGMVLGQMQAGGRYGEPTYKAYTDRGTLGDQIKAAFKNIKGQMDYPKAQSPERINKAVERAEKKTKNNAYVSKNGKIYRNENGELVEQELNSKEAERVNGMLGIRDALRELQNSLQQGLSEDIVKKARKTLNDRYNKFVKSNGFLNTAANRAAFKSDPDSFSLLALENWDAETKKATKADIFEKNTIAPNVTITSAKDVSEGLIVSRNRTGGVDVPLIAKLTGESEASVTRELLDSRLAFKNNDGVLEPAETYLSGNVRAKLRDAEALVPFDADYKINVEALKEIVPKDIPYQDIFINPGTPWIPSSVYSEFAAHILGGRAENTIVKRNPETGNYTVDVKDSWVKYSAANTQKWGTSKRSFVDLFNALLNSRSVVVRYKDVEGKSIVDKDATAAAGEKIEAIKTEFQEWIWKDETRREELSKLYNETFNAIVTPKYNGDHLTVNGANALKPLRPHQRDAVQRIISSGGNTLLAHKVGAGKTYEMAAAAMKLKELGLVNKPMFAVPKSLVAQWGKEFKDFFPTAKLLVAENSDFSPANRKVYMNRIANGNYDAVIVSYEQFEKLPISDEFTMELYQEQIDEVIAAIEEAKAEGQGRSLSVKDLEKKRKSLEAKIEKLTSKPKDEDNISFEQLGVDALFIDEAHNFKNLFYTTSMSNVAGLGNKDGSQRAFDLFTKVRYLQKLNGGKGIVFATATPVMNSMSEMYIMQKYLQPDTLKQLGIYNFDAWAKQFGEVVNGVEIKPSGQGFRVKQSFSKFKNLPELQMLFRNFADVLTDIPGLKIPKMKGGKVTVVECEPSEFQQEYMKDLEKRSDNIKNVDPSEDNMLKITSDGKKVSYTQRMIDPSLPYEEGNKIFKCADNVLKLYKESAKNKGTQLVFLDAGVPKGQAKASEEMDMDKAALYEDLKARLVKGGIPAKEIAFIHSADTDAKKKKLFADVNEGKVRVLIGSTGKMGVGMNAQKRVVAIHHLDAPYRPGDIEQRDGRAFRQGNINDEVEKFVYVTVGSFDARLWDILDRKQGFINQIMNGDSVGRDAEDTGEVTLSAAEVKALASGNPLIEEQVKLDTEIKKLESLRRAHVSAIREAEWKLQQDKSDIAMLKKRITAGEQDLKIRTKAYEDSSFSIKVGRKSYTDKKEAGAALVLTAQNKAEEEYTDIGSFAGFTIKAAKTIEGYKGLLSGKKGYPFKIYPDSPTYGMSHLISVVSGMEDEVESNKKLLAATKADLQEQIELSQKPYNHQEELDQKRTRFNEIMEILNPKEEQNMGELEEQEESREYLQNENAVSSMREAPISREFIDYKETNKIAQAIKKTDAQLVNDGQTVTINSQKVKTHDNVDWKQVGKSRDYLEGILKQFQGKQVYFTDNGFKIKASLTKNGINHSKTSPHGKYSAAIFTEYYALIDKAKYSYSSDNDVHSKGNSRIEEKIDWDYFVTHVDVDGIPFSVVFHIRTLGLKKENHSSQIYRIVIKKETASSHDARQQNKVLSEQPNYEGITVSGYNISEDGDKVNTLDAKGFDEQNQARTKSFSDREILTLASEGVKVEDMTEAEKNALDIFQKKLATLEKYQTERVEMGKLWHDQQFGTVRNSQEARKTLNKMHILDDKVKAATDAVLKVEESEVLRRVLKEARKIVEKQERAKGDEKLRRWREKRNNFEDIKKYRQQIQSDVDELSKWVLHPSNKNVLKHMPEPIKQTVIPFLMSINFSSKQRLRGGRETKADMAFMDRLYDLKAALKENQDTRGMYSGYNDLPPYFMERLDDFISAAQRMLSYSDVAPDEAGEYVINNMSADELHYLATMIKNLKQLIINMNKFHMNGVFKHVYDAGDESIEFMSKLDPKKKASGLSNFLMWQQIRPAYAFARFGEGGKAVFDELRKGQSTLAHNTKTIADFAEQTYTAEEVRSWEKETKTFNINGESVEIPIANIMSLYCLRKRPQALTHIYGSGVRVATWSDKDGRHSDNREVHGLTTSELYQITDSLTPRQKKVAELLQSFMAKQGGDWGNYVSVARFGEKLFGEKEYFPINSDGRHLPADADEKPAGASLYALLNMSFTKELKKDASNRIVLYSIFDVFSNHMASMAQYNAFALPVVDTLKWFNYRQVDFDDKGNKIFGKSVREEMARAYGAPDEDTPGKGRSGYAEKFMLGILKSFNGTEAQGTPTDTTGVNALHKYNMAQVAFNLRSVIQQPLAITRAAMLINYRSIIKGLRTTPEKIKANIEEMKKYSGIALWKSLGFYDVNISRGLTAVIKHDKGPMEKIGDIGLWGAEQADTITWASIWAACKEEVSRGMQPGTDEYYKTVTDLFEEVIYKTQVVDSVLTKNEFLRSKGFFSRAIGSFMSEPTTTASMLIDAYDKYSMDLQRGYSKSEAWRKNNVNITRTVYVYSIGAIMLAAAQAVADAWRDDDDYMTFAEKWLDAFKGNVIDELMPLNKLPFFNDIYEVFKSLLNAMGVDTYGNEPRSLWMQWRKSLVQGFEIIHKRISGDNTSGYTWYGGAYKLLQAASGITGLPMAAATREIVTAWNNTAGAISPKLKVKSYEPSAMSQVKYAYQDGYLTEDEATKELLKKKLAKNEDAAYWIIRGWESGGSKYSRIYADVLEGKDIKAAMDELTSHGETEKHVLSQIKQQVGEDYISGNLSREQAGSILGKYCKLDNETASSAIDKWSAERETGIKYSDIDEVYQSGELSAAEAKNMWTKYGGKTEEEADDMLTVIDFKEKHAELDWDSSVIRKYKADVEPSGISVEAYDDYLEGKKNCKGTDLNGDGKTDSGSVKSEVMALIDSLPLSPDQKDTLYIINGWSERTISEAPWH